MPLQIQAGFRRQPKQILAHLSSTVPAARVPLAAAHVIAAVEHLRKGHASELCHGKKRRRFHLNREAAFGLAKPHFARRLAVLRVRRPGLADEVGHAALLERLLDSRPAYTSYCARTKRFIPGLF